MKIQKVNLNGLSDRLSKLVGTETLEVTAKKLGVSNGTIWRILNGIGSPTVTTIRKIARGYRASEEWLIKGEGKPFADLAVPRAEGSKLKSSNKKFANFIGIPARIREVIQADTLRIASEKTGVADRTIWRILNEEGTVNITTLLRIAKGYGASEDYLLRGDGEPFSGGKRRDPNARRDSVSEIHPGLVELFADHEVMAEYKPTAEEIRILMDVQHTSPKFKPDKQFFVDMLNAIRRTGEK